MPRTGMLDQRIGDGPWLDGELFSFADIACGHILHQYQTLDWPRPRLDNLRAYHDRLQGREPYRTHAMVSHKALKGLVPGSTPRPQDFRRLRFGRR